LTWLKPLGYNWLMPVSRVLLPELDRTRPDRCCSTDRAEHPHPCLSEE